MLSAGAARERGVLGRHERGADRLEAPPPDGLNGSLLGERPRGGVVRPRPPLAAMFEIAWG